MRLGAPIEQYRVHPGLERSLDILTNTVANHHGIGRLDVHQPERRVEDAGVGFHVAVFGGRDSGGNQVLKLEMLQEGRETAMRVGHEPEQHSRLRKGAQHPRDFLVELEVLARCPLRVDLAGAGVELVTPAAHLLDDMPRVSDEYFHVVDGIARAVQNRCRARDCAIEAARIDVDPVPSTKRMVSFAPERRARVNQREVDIEENRTNHTGPAMTIDARCGSR
jgi:hypothetical protein